MTAMKHDPKMWAHKKPTYVYVNYGSLSRDKNKSCPVCGRGFRGEIPVPHKPTSCVGSTAENCSYKGEDNE